MKTIVLLLSIISLSVFATDSTKTEVETTNSAKNPIEKALVFEFGYIGVENKEISKPELSEYQGYEIGFRKNYLIKDQFGTSTGLSFTRFAYDNEFRDDGYQYHARSSMSQVKIAQRFYYDIETSTGMLIRQFAEIAYGQGDAETKISIIGAQGSNTNDSYTTRGLSFGGEIIFTNRLILSGRYAFDNAIIIDDGSKIKTKNYSVTLGYAI